MSDSRLGQAFVETAWIHESAVDRLTGGENKLVSVGSPSKAVDESALDSRQSEIIAQRNLIRGQEARRQGH
jgi:hypothetical protein